MPVPRLILASTSPYRRQLLERLRLPFEAVAPDCDERPLPNERSAHLVERLAETKARSVAVGVGDAWVIGSDQVALLDEHVLGKPGDHARAVEQLQACSGRSVVFRTGLSLVSAADGSAVTEHVDYEVAFRNLTDDEIERYLAAEQPYDCAGSIRSEGYGITLFERMAGDDPNALIGLPLIRVAALLRGAGFTLP
ncbi:MAG: Maf family nucleotide pyrophosphatase [Halofilum sp. (in: g-proteobacteria)]